MAAPKQYTPWHPLFAETVRSAYRHRSIVHSEYQLTGWPLRGDVLLIEKDPAAGSPPVGLPQLPAIGMCLGRRYTLLELKGPTDDLERLDLPQLIGYGSLLEVKEDIQDPGDIHLITVSSSLPPSFRQRVERAGGHFVQRDRGQHLVDGLMYPLFCIEVAPASETAGNSLLYAFSREHLRDPPRLWSRLSPDERALYAELCQHIQQLRQDKRIMQMKDADLFEKSTDEILRDVVARMSPELLKDAVDRIPLRERLRGLAPEERVAGLTPEERLRGLTPEEIKAYLARLP